MGAPKEFNTPPKDGAPSNSEGSPGNLQVRNIPGVGVFLYCKYGTRWYAIRALDTALSAGDQQVVEVKAMGAQTFTHLIATDLTVNSDFTFAGNASDFELQPGSIDYGYLVQSAQRIQARDADATVKDIYLKGGGGMLQLVGTDNEATVDMTETSGGWVKFTVGLPDDIDIVASLDVGTALGVGTSITAGTTLDVTGLITGTGGLALDNFSVADETGNVIIGGNLTVSGSTTTVHSTTHTIGDHNIELNTNAASPGSETDSEANAGGFILHGDSDYTIQWYNATNTWNFNQGLIINSDTLVVDHTSYMSRVGINTATPDRALDIAGNASEGGIRYTGAAGANSILVAGNTGLGGIDFKTVSNVAQPYNHFLFTDGNVGIGEASPSAQLHVNNPSAAIDTILLVENDVNNQNSVLKLQGENNEGGAHYTALRLDGTSEKFIIDMQDTANVFTIQQDGLVGIGEVAPDTTLEVLSGTTNQLKLSFADGNDATFGVNTDGNLTITPSGTTIFTPDALTNLRSTSYVSGLFTGSGWNIYKDANNAYNMEVDNLWVRGSMFVWELVINKIRATNGSLVITSSAECSAAVFVAPGADPLVADDQLDLTFSTGKEDADGDNGAIDYHPFKDGDLLLAHDSSLGADGSSFTIREIRLRVMDDDIDAVNVCRVKIIAGTTADTNIDNLVGMAFVRIGSTADANRRGGVYLTSDDSQAPFIDIWNNVDAFTGSAENDNWVGTGKVKTRLGRLDGITSGVQEYGMWAGASSTNYLVASNEGVEIHSDADTYTKYTGSNIEFFDGSKKMDIGGGNIRMYANDGSTVTGEWTDTTMTIGDVTQNNIYITNSKVALRDGVTEYIVLNNNGTASIAGSVTIGGVALETTTADASSANQDSTVDIQAGTSASDVGLENVTNESKATMFTSPAITGTPTGISSTHVGLGNVSDITTDTMRATAAATSGTIGPITISASGGGGGGARLYQGAGNYDNSDTGFYMDSAGNFSLKNKLNFNGTILEIDGAGTFSGALSGATGSFSGNLSCTSSGGDVGLTILNEYSAYNVLEMNGYNSRVIIGGTHDGDGTSTGYNSSNSNADGKLDIHGGNQAGAAGIQLYDNWFNHVTRLEGQYGQTRLALYEGDGEVWYNIIQGTPATVGNNIYLGNVSANCWIYSPEVAVAKILGTGSPYNTELQGYVRPVPTTCSLDGDQDGNAWNITKTIVPDGDSTYAIGSAGNRYSTLYVDTIVTTNDIETQYTAAKCTDVHADQTSQNYAKGIHVLDKDNDSTCYPLFASHSATGTDIFVYSDSLFRWDSAANLLYCNLEGRASGLKLNNYSYFTGALRCTGGTSGDVTSGLQASSCNSWFSNTYATSDDFDHSAVVSITSVAYQGQDREKAVLELLNTSGIAWQIGISYAFGNAQNMYLDHRDGTNDPKGISINDGGGYSNSFTGFHRCAPEEGDGYTDHYQDGYIVSSTGDYDNPNTFHQVCGEIEQVFEMFKPNASESVPVVVLADSSCDKKVLGVVSGYESNGATQQDWQGAVESHRGQCFKDRLFINSLGEGAVWVTNYNGDLENGDYITSSEIPGLGVKQDDDLLHNYTVAKITQDCSFELDDVTYDCLEFEHEGQPYKKAFVGCTYHCG